MPDPLFFDSTVPPTRPSPSADTVATALGCAREKYEAVQENIESSAQEMMVINAVLKQELPDSLKTGEVAQALKMSDALEVRMQKCAHELAEVNQALQQEVGERDELERELTETKAALARATARPRKP